MKYPLSTSLVLAALTATLFSQGGPLTPPPGAPAPTMKPLDLVEPRIPLVAGAPGVAIVSGTITISQAGSYFLTENHEYAGTGDAIRILADGTTLDLMGHSIIFTGPGNAGAAIDIDASSVHVHNGHILSTSTFDFGGFTPRGFAQGIAADGIVRRVTVRNLAISGVAGNSINLAGHGGQVNHCSASISGSDAIYNPHGSVHECVVHVSVLSGITASVVENCNVIQAFGRGIVANVVTNSHAQSSSNSPGILAETVENSYGQSSGSHGISANHAVIGSRGTSTSTSSTSHGINCSAGAVVGSSGTTSGGHGISARTVSASSGISSGIHGNASCGIFSLIVNNSRGENTGNGGGHGIDGGYSVTGSVGISNNGYGIFARPEGGGFQAFGGIVSNSYGLNKGGVNREGVRGRLVHQSMGWSEGSHGIHAEFVSHSWGRVGASGQDGIRGVLISYSQGERPSTHATYVGIRAERAIGCRPWPLASKDIIHEFLMP